jgi:hypothetical protein
MNTKEHKRYLEYRIEITNIPKSKVIEIDTTITNFREDFNQEHKPIKLHLYESENQTKAVEAL